MKILRVTELGKYPGNGESAVGWANPSDYANRYPKETTTPPGYWGKRVKIPPGLAVQFIRTAPSDVGALRVRFMSHADLDDRDILLLPGDVLPIPDQQNGCELGVWLADDQAGSKFLDLTASLLLCERGGELLAQERRPLEQATWTSQAISSMQANWISETQADYEAKNIPGLTGIPTKGFRSGAVLVTQSDFGNDRPCFSLAEYSARGVVADYPIPLGFLVNSVHAADGCVQVIPFRVSPWAGYLVARAWTVSGTGPALAAGKVKILLSSDDEPPGMQEQFGVFIDSSLAAQRPIGGIPHHPTDRAWNYGFASMWAAAANAGNVTFTGYGATNQGIRDGRDYFTAVTTVFNTAVGPGTTNGGNYNLYSISGNLHGITLDVTIAFASQHLAFFALNKR